MLSNSKLPLSYWSYAVTTATHIINRLPTPWLHHKSPWELLFNSLPDLAHLGTYGCTCFPLLWSYNIHKLQPHTKPCIFLGYPAYFKGYICLEPFLFVYTYQDTSYSMKKKILISWITSFVQWSICIFIFISFFHIFCIVSISFAHISISCTYLSLLKIHKILTTLLTLLLLQYLYILLTELHPSISQ